jgi:hypothetical protein
MALGGAEGARRHDQRVLPRGVADLMNTRSDAIRLVLKRTGPLARQWCVAAADAAYTATPAAVVWHFQRTAC